MSAKKKKSQTAPRGPRKGQTACTECVDREESDPKAQERVGRKLQAALDAALKLHKRLYQ